MWKQMFPLLLLLCSEILSPLLLQMVLAEMGETALDAALSDTDDGSSSVAMVEIWFGVSFGFFEAGDPAADPGIWLKFVLR